MRGVHEAGCKRDLPHSGPCLPEDMTPVDRVRAVIEERIKVAAPGSWEDGALRGHLDALDRHAKESGFCAYDGFDWPCVEVDAITALYPPTAPEETP